MDEVSVEQARAKLGEIVDRARLAGQPTCITKNGKRAAVVVSAEWARDNFDQGWWTAASETTGEPQ